MAVILFASSMVFGQFMDGNELYKYLLTYESSMRTPNAEVTVDFATDLGLAVGYIKGVYDLIKTTNEINIYFNFPPNIILRQIIVEFPR